MMNLIFFVINIVGICAMMTFAPALAFALANTIDANGKMVWPVLLPNFKITA